MYEIVKSKGELHGLNVPELTEYVYQAWLDSEISLPLYEPELPELSYEEQVRQGEQWFAEMDEMVNELANSPVEDSRTCREILNDDRNRLKPGFLSLYPGRNGVKTNKKTRRKIK